MIDSDNKSANAAISWSSAAVPEERGPGRESERNAPLGRRTELPAQRTPALNTVSSNSCALAVSLSVLCCILYNFYIQLQEMEPVPRNDILPLLLSSVHTDKTEPYELLRPGADVLGKLEIGPPGEMRVHFCVVYNGLLLLYDSPTDVHLYPLQVVPLHNAMVSLAPESTGRRFGLLIRAPINEHDMLAVQEEEEDPPEV